MTEQRQTIGTSARRKRSLLFYFVALILGLGALWLICVSPFLFFEWGWSDVTSVSRYPELLASVHPELRRALPPSVPTNATNVRVRGHAGMLQARPWLELGFVLSAAEAQKIENAGALFQDSIGDTHGLNLQSWLPRLRTLGHPMNSGAVPSTLHVYLLAVHKAEMGFAAVAVDSTTGEVVYWTWSD